MIFINSVGGKMMLMAEGSKEDLFHDLCMGTAQLILKYMRENQKTPGNLEARGKDWGEMVGRMMVNMTTPEGMSRTCDMSSDVVKKDVN